MDFKKQGRVVMLRLKNFTIIILKYNIFEVVTSWLDTVLSPFLHTVDDGFRDFWTNACYHLADSFLQLGHSLGTVYMYSFLQGRSQDFSKGWAKLHIIFSYNINILSKFPAHGHVKINYEVEQNYSDSFGIELNV